MRLKNKQSNKSKRQEAFRITKESLKALEKIISMHFDKTGLDKSVRRLEKMRVLSEKLRLEIEKEEYFFQSFD